MVDVPWLEALGSTHGSAIGCKSVKMKTEYKAMFHGILARFWLLKFWSLRSAWGIQLQTQWLSITDHPSTKRINPEMMFRLFEFLHDIGIPRIFFESESHKEWGFFVSFYHHAGIKGDNQQWKTGQKQLPSGHLESSWCDKMCYKWSKPVDVGGSQIFHKWEASIAWNILKRTSDFLLARSPFVSFCVREVIRVGFSWTYTSGMPVLYDCFILFLVSRDIPKFAGYISSNVLNTSTWSFSLTKLP